MGADISNTKRGEGDYVITNYPKHRSQNKSRKRNDNSHCRIELEEHGLYKEEISKIVDNSRNRKVNIRSELCMSFYRTILKFKNMLYFIIYVC